MWSPHNSTWWPDSSNSGRNVWRPQLCNEEAWYAGSCKLQRTGQTNLTTMCMLPKIIRCERHEYLSRRDTIFRKVEYKRHGQQQLTLSRQSQPALWRHGFVVYTAMYETATGDSGYFRRSSRFNQGRRVIHGRARSIRLHSD